MEYVQHRTDLSVIAITDHNTVEARSSRSPFPSSTTSKLLSAGGFLEGRSHPRVVSSKRTCPAGMSTADTIRAIEDQGGIAVIAHPFSNQGVFGPLGRNVFAEAVHEGAFSGLGGLQLAALPDVGEQRGRQSLRVQR